MILAGLKRKIYFDIGDYRRTIFLAGTGRSGTTWVQDVINYDGSYRIMFEPFHSKKNMLLTEWNYRQYLRVDNHQQKFLKPATVILSGKIRDPWVDKYNKRIFVSKRLIKDIRANLILKWIKENFAQIPVILLLRHPCAVASSKLKLGWDTHLDDFLRQAELMQDFLNPFKKEILAAKDIFDKHIFMWCIENYVPLRQFREGEILVIFYEDLCVSPKKNINEIMDFLGEKAPTNLPELLEKPSPTSRVDSAVVSGTNLLEAWNKNISDQQVSRAFEILEFFGLQQLYGREGMPLLEGKEALKLFSTPKLDSTKGI